MRHSGVASLVSIDFLNHLIEFRIVDHESKGKHCFAQFTDLAAAFIPLLAME